MYISIKRKQVICFGFSFCFSDSVMNATRANQHFQLFDTIPWMVVYICEATVILTENLITAYIFWNIRRRLRRASYLLINLAVADFTVGIALIFWLWDGIAAIKGRHLSYSVGEKNSNFRCNSSSGFFIVFGLDIFGKNACNFVAIST